MGWATYPPHDTDADASLVVIADNTTGAATDATVAALLPPLQSMRESLNTLALAAILAEPSYA